MARPAPQPACPHAGHRSAEHRGAAATAVSYTHLDVYKRQAQDSLQTNWLVEFGYGFQLGMADFNDRYGSHGKLEGTVLKKMGSWELGPSYEYYFGSTVKEDVLRPLRTPEGDLIGGDHQLTQVDFRLRGMLMGLRVNKEIRIKKSAH